MSADLINLNRVRKAKARQDQAVRAEENRARFGRTKAEKNKAKAEAEMAARQLDGHRRDTE
ncbi:DUF4169 family protein [Kaistia dalseonensis]|uniref:DUF4169 domain-containing protein n=1 Tax=Kaistia dalseonensis TaxID=410840 RepID=A0ABU0HCR7_9HYPH|nr:DUF4169 family protein [Kaistia dalseonensis]MCX5497111.1 DUF4169 family protein [Kaistia dalseonensis]MDQ0439737.1 hypothetical protein [Kaistia dalseonensis]